MTGRSRAAPLLTPPDRIKPCAVHAYVDKIIVWFPQTLNGAQVAFLRQNCPTLIDTRDVRDLTWLRQKDPRSFAYWSKTRLLSLLRPRLQTFRHSLMLFQPRREALEWIARHAHHITSCELANDLIYDTYWAAQSADDFVDQHFVKKHHSGKTRYFGASRMTGDRKAANNIILYADKPSRNTGQPCCHLEWRIRGRAALKAAGIGGAADLLTFDHRRFWRERLLIAKLDLQRLGRLNHSNLKRRLSSQPQQRRRSWGTKWGTIDVDLFARRGALLVSALPRPSIVASDKPRSVLCTVQDVCDGLKGKKVRVSDCLMMIDNNHLLPPQTSTL
jgi:hypothetical protein